MNNTLDHKCPNCNAVLKFNPHGQNWKCEYCSSEFDLKQLEEYEEKTGKTLEKEAPIKKGDLDVYICKNCGAQIVADPNVSTTSCVYCKNTAILKDKLQGEFSPNYVIPFRKTKEDAIEAFMKLKKGRILTPKAFNNKNNIKEMSGIYIPFWLYDYNANGIIEADCKRITSWTSGNYRYTKTDIYKATRGGSVAFENIPVDGSKRFQNDIMNSIEPFDYKDIKDFNYSYLSGFLSEKYDVSMEEAKTDSVERAKQSFKNQMVKDIRGYDSVSVSSSNINLEDLKNSYALLPVWMLNIKYKDKIYTFAMNGQTGKMIGNIPIDKLKAVVIWFIIAIVTFVIGFLIMGR